ncbi:MAG: DUF559 domain-containing protein, partial [Paraclostridium sp.]
EIAKTLKRKRDTIVHYVVISGLGFENRSKNKYLMPTSSEFARDIGNPMYSHSALGRMYGYSELVIKKWRDTLFGDFKTMVDTFRCMTVPEIDFKDLLEEMSLSYLYEYKVLGYKVDFYLGAKLIVEIQGDYWHSKEDVKVRDKKKKEILESNGYTIIYINESDFKDKDVIKKLIITNYKECVNRL